MTSLGPDTPMSDLLKGEGGRPYRDLVEAQVRSQSAAKLAAGCLGTVPGLPPGNEERVVTYIDLCDLVFGNDTNFWESATCTDAFEAVLGIALETLSLGDSLCTPRDALKPENEAVAFVIFQLPTLNFAYLASTRRQQRECMGMGHWNPSDKEGLGEVETRLAELGSAPGAAFG